MTNVEIRDKVVEGMHSVIEKVDDALLTIWTEVINHGHPLVRPDLDIFPEEQWHQISDFYNRLSALKTDLANFKGTD